MQIHDKYQDIQDRFAILAFHDTRAKTLEELDEKLEPIVESRWGGRQLPFPILTDATGKTIAAYGITAYPTIVVIDPEGKLVKGGGEKLFEDTSPDGRRLASGAYMGPVRVWDVETGDVQFELRVYASSPVAFSPDGRLLATGYDVAVVLQDVATPDATLDLEGLRGQRILALDRGGARLASATRGSLCVWDTETGATLLTVPNCWAASFMFMALSPDGRRLAAGAEELHLQIWDVDTGRALASLSGVRRGQALCLAFSPSGDLLATGMTDGIVRLWDTATGMERAALEGSRFLGDVLAWSPDGRRLAAGSQRAQCGPGMSRRAPCWPRSRDTPEGGCAWRSTRTVSAWPPPPVTGQCACGTPPDPRPSPSCRCGTRG